MKKYIVILITTITISSQADIIIAGWDVNWGSTPSGTAANVTGAGINASVTADSSTFSRGATPASTDGTFGTYEGAGISDLTSAWKGGYSFSGTNAHYIEITVSNIGTETYDLTSFSFDMQRQYSGAPRYYTLSIVSGDLSAGDVVVNAQNTIIGGTDPDFVDIDISLAGLSDYTLAAGESAVFRLKFNAGATSTHKAFVDNIAVMAVLGASSGPTGPVIAGWDSWEDSITNSTASVVAANFSASLSTSAGDWTRTASGSTDLTFGTENGAGSSSNLTTGGLFTQVLDAEGNQSYLDFKITNNGTSNCTLSNFNFDMQRQYGTSPRYYRVDVVSGSDITTGNLVNDQYLGATDPLDLNYADFDISLSGLADNVLAAGESATFRLKITGGNDSARTFIDNVAITTVTDAEPETASATILSIAPVSASVMKLEISSDNPSLCYPKTTVELTTNTIWISAGHSTNGLTPFIVTNLSYSTASGTNMIIYVEADQDVKFFNIGDE